MYIHEDTSLQVGRSVGHYIQSPIGGLYRPSGNAKCGSTALEALRARRQGKRNYLTAAENVCVRG